MRNLVTANKYIYLIFVNIYIILSLKSSQVNGLICYSCSTEAGDPFCSEDGFNRNLTYVQCPSHSDVCVRAIQVSNANPKSDNNVGTVVFRSCGSSAQSKSPEITNLGFMPLYNDCIIHKIGNKESIFYGSTFQICSCSTDLGNSKGEMKCK